MNWFNSILILAVAFLVVFWEAAFSGMRNLVGAQLDLLPALMVYAGLSCGVWTVVSLSLLGGLWFDSLSANPLGVSILPLFLIGLVIHVARELILRNQAFAQFTLGLGACAVAPLITLLLLLSTGRSPLFGWGTLWQIMVMSVGGAIATPLVFGVFEWLNQAFIHSRVVDSSFRPDREIRRGRL